MVSTFQHFLLHPCALNLFQALLSVAILGYTPFYSSLRILALPLACIFPLLLFFPPHPIYSYSRPLSALFAGNTLGFFLQYLDAAVISRWSFEAQGPTSRDGGLASVVDKQHPPSSHTSKTAKSPILTNRTLFGLWIALPLSTRLVGLPWQVIGTPDFPGKWVPSRVNLLRKAVLRLVICLLVFDLAGVMGGEQGIMEQQNQELFAGARVPILARLNDVTVEEVLMRAAVSFFMWLIGYCVVQAIYSAMAIVAVGSGMTGVDGWKTLFGGLDECWSIRQFWGRFWHQSLRTRLSSPAHYFTYKVLRLRKGALLGRYTLLSTAFFISALFHVGEDVSEGMKWRESGSVRFFCMQPLGIMIEDALQAMYHRTENRSHRWYGARMLGYIWFIAWMTWTTPAWVYPKLRITVGGSQDRMLPFSLLAMVF